MDLTFLKSNRFWALVIGSLTLVSNGSFTKDAWTKGVLALVTGFIAIRTLDRATQPLPNATPVPPNLPTK